MKPESVETKQHPQTPEQILREAFDKIRDQHNLVLNNVAFRHSNTSSGAHLIFCEIDANTRG